MISESIFKNFMRIVAHEEEALGIRYKRETHFQSYTLWDYLDYSFNKKLDYVSLTY